MAVRTATPKDLRILAKIAKEGFASSPVYSFIRIRAEEYEGDVIDSYLRELMKLIADPQFLIMVIERHNPGRVKEKRMRHDKSNGIRSETLEYRYDCFSRWRASRKAYAPMQESSSEILGFAVWKLSSKSKYVDRSVTRKLEGIKSHLANAFYFQRNRLRRRDTCPRRAQLLSNALKAAHQKYFINITREIPQMELRQLVVAPKYQRQGYGTMLIQQGLQIANEEGVGVLVYSTPIGQMLYQKVGFEEIGDVVAKDLEYHGKACIERCQVELSAGQATDSEQTLGEEVENAVECRLLVFEWWPTLGYEAEKSSRKGTQS